MPTTRCGHVRYLLKEKKARVVKTKPFTIQLLYETNDVVQPLYLGIDPGRTNIGVAVVKADGTAVFTAHLETRNKEIPKLMKKRKDSRCARRTNGRRCRRQRRAKADALTQRNQATAKEALTYTRNLTQQAFSELDAVFSEFHDTNVTPMWMQDDAIQIPTAATKEQLEKKDNYFTFRSLSMQLADDGNSKYFSFDENSQTLYANCLEAKEYAMRLLHTYCKGVKAVTGKKQDADGHTVYCIQGIYSKPLKASLWDEVREHIIKTRDYKKMNRVLGYTPDAVTDLDLLRYVLDKAAAVLPDELIRKWYAEMQNKNTNKAKALPTEFIKE